MSGKSNYRMTMVQLPFVMPGGEVAKLFELAARTVRDECCLNDCVHCVSKAQGPLDCAEFSCGEFILECDSYACKGVA